MPIKSTVLTCIQIIMPMCLSTTSLYACKLVSFQKLENRLNQPTMFLTSGLDQKQDSNEQHIYIYTLPSITTVCYILGSKTDFSALLAASIAMRYSLLAVLLANLIHSCLD